MFIGEKECCLKYFYVVSFKSCRGSISSDNRINSRVNRSGKVSFYFFFLEFYGEVKNILLIVRLFLEERWRGLIRRGIVS